MPREFSHVLVTCVYIPPDANTRAAADTLASHVQDLDTKAPDAFKVMCGDFNSCTPSKKDLPGYYQHVHCKTRFERTIDLCFTNVPEAYNATAMARLGNSDHNVIALLPKYRPIVKREPAKRRTVQVWSEEAKEALQGPFDTTD